MAIDTNKLQQQAADLSSQLWAIANDLRGGMDANEFRNYSLGTIFYRYLSERTEMYMEDILKEDGLTYEQAFSDSDFKPIVEQWSLEHLGYIICPENLFRELKRVMLDPAYGPYFASCLVSGTGPNLIAAAEHLTEQAGENVEALRTRTNRCRETAENAKQAFCATRNTITRIHAVDEAYDAYREKLLIWYKSQLDLDIALAAEDLLHGEAFGEGDVNGHGSAGTGAHVLDQCAIVEAGFQLIIARRDLSVCV